MLSVPKYGWVNITIGDWTDRASYLTDVPMDLLDCFIHMLSEPRNHIPGCVYFDAEGWEYILVFNWGVTYVIESKDDEKLYTLDKGVLSIAEEVYLDISKHLHEWSSWDFNVEDEERRKIVEKELSEKLAVLRDLIDKAKKRYKAV